MPSETSLWYRYPSALTRPELYLRPPSTFRLVSGLSSGDEI